MNTYSDDLNDIHMARRLLTCCVFSITMMSFVVAAELIMIEQEGCIYCKKFDREISVAYPKTAEGRRAPLRRVDLHEPWPVDLANIKSEPYTPTFVLVENNQEVDRIIGYPGDEHFWFLLGEMLQKLEDHE